jgi:hypothetical protein
MTTTEKTKPTPSEFAIARRRLMDEERDCGIGAGPNKVWVQLFTPSDARKPDSMVMSAAHSTIKKIIPHCKVSEMAGDGCLGILIPTHSLEYLRQVMRQEKSQPRGRRL